jgi:hypothetical protein
VVGDRLEPRIVGLEVLEEVEADDRLELRVETQRVEARAPGGRDPKITIDDPEGRGNPGQEIFPELLDG